MSIVWCIKEIWIQEWTCIKWSFNDVLNDVYKGNNTGLNMYGGMYWMCSKMRIK